MSKRMFALFAVVTLVGPAAADDDAKKVVEKAVTAHGGADALKKYKAGKATMKGDLSVAGMDLTFEGTVAYELPDKFKVVIDSSVMGMALKVVQVANGEKVKHSVMLGGMDVSMATEEEKDEVRLSALEQDLTRVLPMLNEKKYSLKAEPDGDIDGKKVAVVKITVLDNSKTVIASFDKESGLLVKLQRKGRGAGADGTAKEMEFESFLTDFKKVNGVQVAMKMVVKQDGAKFMTLAYDDMELLESLPAGTFATDN
jgi:hypothetical protein